MNKRFIILIMFSFTCIFGLFGKLRRSTVSLPYRQFKVPAEYKKKASESSSSSVFSKLVHIFDESDSASTPKAKQASAQELKRKKLWRKDFSLFHITYLEHPVATTFDLFDDDIQLDLSAEEIDYQNFLRSQYGKLLDTHAVAQLYIGWVNSIIGYGLFANAPIKRGDYIGECTGKIVPLASIDPHNTYLFHYPSSNPKKQFVIDAQSEGSLLRFINHDVKPNVECEYIFYKGIWHLVMIAADDILVGHQLSIDYGPNFWKNRKEPLPVF